MAKRSRTRLAGVAGIALAVVGQTLAWSGPSVAQPTNADPEGIAAARLQGDADGAVTQRGRVGSTRFVGVPSGSRVDNPAVTPSTSPGAAADAHLARYGAMFGTKQPGTNLARTRVADSVAGDVVRYQQTVSGIPVLGGEIAVSLGEDRELTSVLADLSTASKASPATVSATDAQQIAKAAAAKSLDSALSVNNLGVWLLDPAVSGGSAATTPRTVWKIEVSSGPAARRLILVDANNGAVLHDTDDMHAIDRVVCDNEEVPDPTEGTCTADFDRVEGGAPSMIEDVEQAFAFSGDTSTMYDDVAGLDLTDLLGMDIGGVKKLASTVRFCYTAGDCPYANAFWTGEQMFYGTGYASADDVVGHEITHGVIDRFSSLFYWGQSGAMNESIADIMGEIQDHRDGAGDADDDSAWDLAEALPIGRLRNLSDPTLGNDPANGSPDKMTSDLYWPDLTYLDNGGVHFNSGVGNKTAYLISQGGTFNGQTITGIDGADDTLLKTATLYVDVIQSLVSGSAYRDLADVLEQSCQDLIGIRGFTAADCDEITKVIAATELRTTPPGAAQPADADADCPVGETKTVLFDSETGDPASKFDAESLWLRGVNPDWGPNATSGQDTWFGADPQTTAPSSITAAAGIALPAGQSAYLHFNQWRLFEYDGATTYDGGTVEIDDVGDANPPSDAAGLPWVNGPEDTLFGTTTVGFGADSYGYIASRLDLSSYAGSTIKPQFTVRGDSTTAYIGWWLDDITVYSCSGGIVDPGDIVNQTLPEITGTPEVGETLNATEGTWTPAGLDFAYQWLRNGIDIAGATQPSYPLTADDEGAQISVEVTASAPGLDPVSATSGQVGPVQADGGGGGGGGITTGTPTITGTLRVGQQLTADPGNWLPAGITFTYTWLRNGNEIPGATAKTFRLSSADLGSQMSVRVTGSTPGQSTSSATSSQTAKVSPALPLPDLVPGKPIVKGTPKVGKTLRVSRGTWSLGLTFAYQWLRDGKVVRNATGVVYKLKAKDRGTKISVRVTGTRSDEASASATSRATKKVKGKKR